MASEYERDMDHLHGWRILNNGVFEGQLDYRGLDYPFFLFRLLNSSNRVSELLDQGVHAAVGVLEFVNAETGEIVGDIEFIVKKFPGGEVRLRDMRGA